MSRLILPELTAEAKKILNDYQSRSFSKNIFEDCWMRLVASLYNFIADVQPYLSQEDDSKVRTVLNNYIFDLDDEFDDLSINILINEYAAIIEYCCDIYGKDYISDESAMKSEPKEISEFISKYFELHTLTDFYNIYLPFAGMGATTIKCGSANICSEEINEIAWAISMIRFYQPYLKGFYTNIHKPTWSISIKDSFDSLTKKDNVFDIALFTPPFRTKSADGYTELDAVMFAIENKLHECGTLCCILPASFLYNSFSSKVGKYLIENRYIHTIITLPQIFKPITSVNTILLVANKQQNKFVKLVNGTSFTSQGLKENGGGRLDVDSLYSTIVNEDSNFVIKKSYKDIISRKAGLDPIVELSKAYACAPNENLYQLNDLIYFNDNSIIDIHDGDELYSIENLSSTTHNSVAKLTHLVLDDKLSKKIAKAKSVKAINCPTLVANFNSKTAEVGKIEETGLFHIYMERNSFCFNTKENLVLPEFLLLSLQSDFVNRQIRNNLLLHPKLHPYDLGKICIPIPDLNSQKEIIFRNLSQSVDDLTDELNKSLVEYKRDVHMKKHAIGQTIFNLNNWIKVLQRARREGNGIVDDNAIIGNIHKVKVTDIYDNIQSSLQKLQIQISKFDSGWGLQKESIALVDFIENYIYKNSSPLFRFIFDSKSHRAKQTLFDESGELIIEQGDALEHIEFPKDALTIIFDNIISNACSHGFSEEDSLNNIIKIDILREDGKYVISLSNNGSPIISDFSSEDIFTYGRSSKEGGKTNNRQHCGIGGYEIRKLMRDFSGEAEILSYPNEEYSVVYKLIFKDTNIIKSF